jgi:DNA-binding LacI/PurR family transcriptional regulator
MSELATPPLTAISFPAEDLGRIAGDLLLERLGGGGDTPPRQVLLRPVLVVRGTTAPAR